MFKNRKFFTKAIAIIIAVFFILISVLPLTAIVHGDMLVAATTTQKKQDIKNNINQKNAEKSSLQSEIKALDNKASTLQSQIDDWNKQIAQDDTKISNTQTKLDDATNKANAQYAKFKDRIRVMYEEGANGYLDVLLQSDNLMDFLNKYEAVKQIAEYDDTLTKKLEETQKEIAVQKEALVSAKQSKQTKVASLNSAKQELNSTIAQQNSKVNEINSDVKTLEAQLKNIEAQEAAARAAAVTAAPKNVQYTGGSMMWPAPGYYTITSPYGYRYHPVLKYNKLHTGIDIGAAAGSTYIAANSGTVTAATYNAAYGYYIIISHGGGISTLYAHSSKLLVSKGQTVTAGQAIGKVGSTGYSTGAHLHFEVLINGSCTNPMNYLK